MKQITQLENYHGGIRCAFDSASTNPACIGLFTAFVAASAGTNNFTGAGHICDAAGVGDCTLEF